MNYGTFRSVGQSVGRCKCKFSDYNIFFQIWTLKASLKEVKYFKEMRGWKSVCKSRADLELSPASMLEFLRKNGERLSPIFAKRFIIDVRLGSTTVSEKTETFKMKVRLAKSWQLSQGAAFLVILDLESPPRLIKNHSGCTSHKASIYIQRLYWICNIFQ